MKKLVFLAAIAAVGLVLSSCGGNDKTNYQLVVVRDTLIERDSVLVLDDVVGGVTTAPAVRYTISEKKMVGSCVVDSSSYQQQWKIGYVRFKSNGMTSHVIAQDVVYSNKLTPLVRVRGGGEYLAFTNVGENFLPATVSMKPTSGKARVIDLETKMEPVIWIFKTKDKIFTQGDSIITEFHVLNKDYKRR